jgi:xanthine dehydrogenase accessory factor
VLQFGVEDKIAWKAGLACGGTIRIFLEPLEGGERDASLLHRLAGDIAARSKAALVTDLSTGARALAHGPEDLGQDLVPALTEAVRQDRSVVVPRGNGEMFINMFAPTTRLVVIGAVHVAQALAPMSRALGYDVVIVDPRAAFATEERLGDVGIMPDWPDEALPAIGLDAATAVVVLSHDAKIDDPALVSALASNAFYIGALGSRKTHAGRLERLKQAGLSDADLARIHAPIGLDIGALGAAEIALSILAEIVAVRRGNGGAGR